MYRGGVGLLRKISRNIRNGTAGNRENRDWDEKDILKQRFYGKQTSLGNGRACKEGRTTKKRQKVRGKNLGLKSA